MSDFDPQITRAGHRHAAAAPLRTRRLSRRLAGVAVFLIGVAAVAIVIGVSLHVHLPFGLSGRAATVAKKPDRHKPRKRAPASPTATVSTLATLLAAASRVAAAPFGASGVLFLGGYDSAGAPTNAIESFDGTAAVQAVGTLPVDAGSAVAATLGASIYLLGGASSSIYAVSQTGSSIVGNLPSATADAAVATVGGTAYVIGGYTGSSELATIVAYTPGSTPQVVAMLPVALRFATAAAIGGEVYVIGGETNGVATSRVYRFDPVSKTVTRFTRLPVARDRESARAIDGVIVVLGGLSTASGRRTRAIYTINPSSGVVHLAGLLPKPISDMTAIVGPGQIIAAGGVTGNGLASAAIYGIKVKAQ